jgi:hypothetical protein
VRGKFILVGQISVFFPPKKMGNFHKWFFLSVNSINCPKLLEKNCKNFQHQKIKEILLFKINFKKLININIIIFIKKTLMVIHNLDAFNH